MSFLVRKIEYSKWTQNDILKGEQPSADAITNCMRTFNNTLSVWAIANTGELEDAVLAIASQFDHVETADFLILETSMIENKAIEIKYTPGKTPYSSFVSNHRDIVNLNYERLGFVAGAIVESIKLQYNKRFTRSKIKGILQQGIKSGKIQPDTLKESVLKRLSL